MPTAEHRRPRSHANSQPHQRSVEKPASNLPQKLAKFWVSSIGVLLTGVYGAVYSAVKDTATSFVPSARSVDSFVTTYPAVTYSVLGIAALATIAALVAVWRDPAAARASRSAITSWLERPIVGLTSLSVATASSCALIGVMALLAVRPAWCPSRICEPGLAGYPGPQDGYIGADVFAIQSDTILIPGDPTAYSLGHLPVTAGARTVAAVLVQPVTGPTAPSNQPYRLAARIQNLRSDLGELSIEAVALVVAQASAPGQVNAWRQGAVADYEENPFLAEYAGETASQKIPALYVGPVPFGHVTLKPGESDVLTVKVWSGLPADVTYRLQISYRYLNQANLRTFVDPQTIEVVFASQLQWSEYQMRGGKMQPA